MVFLKKEFFLFLCSISLGFYSAFAQKNSTGINNTLPSGKAALDVQSSSGAGNQQGILVPRLTGSDTTALKAGITASEKGLFFFDIGNNHYWFWNGAKWVAIGKELTNSTSGWLLTGNTLLAADTGATGFKYLGTNSPFPLVFATNGQQRMRISRTGNVAIGTNMMPVSGVPLSLKSNGIGQIFQIQQSSSTNSLFEFRQNLNNNARLLLYNGSGDIGIELNAEPKESSYFNTGNVGIGNVAPQELLHLTNGALLLEGDIESPTAIPAAGSIKFQGAEGLNHALVNETKSRDLVLWTTFDGKSWRENTRFSYKGEFSTGYPGNSAYGFTVNQFGDLTKINSLNYNWPFKQDKGVLTNDGSGILSWSDVAGGITGAGSTNTVPYWLSTGALGFSNLQYNGSGNFGLGVEPNASYLFQAEGTSSTPLFYLANNGSGAALWAYNGNTAGTALRVQASGGYAGLFTGGNVGIGTTAPVLPLHIVTSNAVEAPTAGTAAVGSLRVSTSDSPLVLDFGLADDLYYGAWLQAHYASNAATKSPILLNPTGGNVSIGTTSANSSLTVSGGTAVGANYVGYAAPANGMIVEGRLGLGTTSPTFNLDINGGTGGSDIHLFNTASGASGADGLRINFSGTVANLLNYESGNFNLGTLGGNIITMTPAGNVGIGTATPTVKLQVAGSICYTGTSAVCSDLRYKERISTIPHVLQALNQFNGVYYFWKTEEFKEKEFLSSKQIGVIAQEIEKVFPELVITDDKGYKSVDYPKLSPILLQAIKEQQVLIDSLTQHDLHQDLQMQQLKSALDIKQKQLEEQKTLWLKHEEELELLRQYLGTQAKDSNKNK